MLLPPLGATALIGACVDFDSLSAGSHTAGAPEDSGEAPPKPGSDAGNGTPPDGLDATAPDDASVAVDSQIVCTDGGIPCNGACVDPTSDPANCNGCGNACATSTCGTTIAAPMTAMPAGWAFNGTAVFDVSAPSAELTKQGVALQAGTVLYMNPIALDTFDATFGFRIGEGGGGRSDGMGFVLEQNGPSAIGGSGSGLGMAGLTGFGVEFDIFNNGACSDTSADHVGVDELAMCSAQAGMPTSVFEADLTSVVDVGDGEWHQAEIKLDAAALSLSIDGTPTFANVQISGISPGATYYVGFSGATGNSLLADGGFFGFRQEVRDVTITFPTPRCL